MGKDFKPFDRSVIQNVRKIMVVADDLVVKERTTPQSEEDELDHILLVFADQISTLGNKYHHKEIDFDYADTLGIGYQAQAKAAIQSALHRAEVEAGLKTIDKVFELSPKGSFANWKPMDAWHFYERLKAYERELKTQLTPTKKETE